MHQDMVGRWYAALAASLIACAALTGCVGSAPAVTPPPQGPSSEGTVYLPSLEGSSSVVLFNRFTQRLLAYDTEAHAVVQQSDVVNYVQYGFNTPSEYFTAGHSVRLGFKLLRVRPGGIETVVEVPDSEGVFPLADDGAFTFFMKTHYDSAGRQDRCTIASLESGGRLRELPNVQGVVAYGAIVGPTLYYTTSEDDGTYSLYSLECADRDGTPALVERGLVAGEVYAHDGKLYRTDQDSIRCGSDSFAKSSLNYFFDKQGVLIQVHPDEQANLALDVVDMKTKQVRDTYRSIVDFSVIGDRLTVYRLGAIDRVDLRLVP